MVLLFRQRARRPAIDPGDILIRLSGMSGNSLYVALFVAVVRFTSLSEARLYGRLESDMRITRFAVNVSYFYYSI